MIKKITPYILISIFIGGIVYGLTPYSYAQNIGTDYNTETQDMLDEIESPTTQENTVNTNHRVQGMDLSCFSNDKGKCGMNIYETLGIKESNQNVEVGTFVQDIVLSATMFFGTVLSFVVFFSGFLYIFSAVQGSENLQSKAKKGLIGGIVGLLLVSGSFAIVRFIQFLAQGGG